MSECNGIACCTCMHCVPRHEHVPPEPVLTPRLLVAARRCEWHPSSSDCFECLLASRRSNQTMRDGAVAAQQTPARKVPVLTRCLPSVGDFFVAGGICLPFGSCQCAKVGGRLQAAFCERHFRHHGGRHEHPESGGPRTTGGSVTGGRTHDRSYQIGVGGAAQPLGAAHRRQATAMATDARDCVLARCCSRLSVCNTCQHTAANPVRGARHRRWD